MNNKKELQITKDDYKFGFHDIERKNSKPKKGLSEDTINMISDIKNEPDWMRQNRLKAYKIFKEKPMPTWGADLSEIDFDEIYYYIKPESKTGKTWDEVPIDIKNTFEKLGIPQAERDFLAGVEAQYDSESIYSSLKDQWQKLGVIFLSTDEALKEFPDIFKKYFGTIVPALDNKFAALNTAVWSGGSFVYIPKGVTVQIPLQAYFRINAKSMGQFERTLIIAEENSNAQYVEGCFLKDAQVRTRTGEKPIQDIKVGDEVYTHKGRYRKVYNTMNRPYNGEIFSIKFYGESHRELHVTEGHPLLLVKRQKAEYRNTEFIPEWTPASQAKTGDYLAIPVPHLETINEQYKRVPVRIGKNNDPIYQNLDIPYEPEMFRLLGYFHAEGHIDKEHYLSFTFNKEEKEYIKTTKNIIKQYFNKDIIFNRERNNGQTIVLCSTKVARGFSNIFGADIKRKKLPEDFQNSSKDCLSEWIRGIWEGDGTYDVKKNNFRIHTVSKSLAYTIRDVLLKVGIISSINLQKRASGNRKDIYAIIISTPYNLEFGKIVNHQCNPGTKVGSPFYLDDKYLYVPIKAIHKDIMDTMVYNFSVEDDESYVAEGVISHNCTAPTYDKNSLHSAVVEIIVKEGARMRYTTIQNWSKNVYNLVTKRAIAHKNATMEWIDGNLGSYKTMKYPSVYLVGEGARGEVLSIAFASSGQHIDSGAKMIHVAPNTTSLITSKSISKDDGKASYRGLVRIHKGAYGSKSNSKCDALLITDKSISDTYPDMQIDCPNVVVQHEAIVSKVSKEQLIYLQSRGFSEDDAMSMIINGFVEPIVRLLPLEYSIEMNRLIELEMEGSVG